MTQLKPTIINGEWTMAPAPEADHPWLDSHPQVIGPMSKPEIDWFLRTGGHPTPNQTDEAIRSSGPQTMEAKR